MALKFSDYNPAAKYGADFDITVDLNQIIDNSGNELLEFDSNSSAVNYIKVANAATANDPEIKATGDDSFVELQLSSTGTATVLLGDSSTGTVASGSALINAQRGTITTAALTTTGGGTHSFDLRNNKIGPSSQIICTLQQGTNTSLGATLVPLTTPIAGSVTVNILNSGTAGVLNGTLKVHFIVF